MAPSEAEGKEDEWRTVNSTVQYKRKRKNKKGVKYFYVKYDNYARMCTININLIILMHDISYVFKF